MDTSEVHKFIHQKSCGADGTLGAEPALRMKAPEQLHLHLLNVDQQFSASCQSTPRGHFRHRTKQVFIPTV